MLRKVLAVALSTELMPRLPLACLPYVMFRCAIAFSGLHCIIMYIPLDQEEDRSLIAHLPVFCLRPDNHQGLLASE